MAKQKLGGKLFHGLMDKKLESFASVMCAMVLFSFLFLDPYVGFKMCTWCFVERMVLVFITFLMVVSIFIKTTRKKIQSLLLAQLLSLVGLGVSVYHAYWVYASEHKVGCGIFFDMTRLKSRAGWSYYNWIECSGDVAHLFGVSLVWWAMTLFLLVAGGCTWMVLEQMNERNGAAKS